MMKGRFKSIIIAGVTASTVLQCIPAMAVTGVGGPGSPNAKKLIYSEDGDIIGTTDSLGAYCLESKGSANLVNADPNMSWYTDIKSGFTIDRYTDEDGDPYTGLYQPHRFGSPDTWKVLDKDGFWRRDHSIQNYAWDNGNMAADFVTESGPNSTSFDDNYYLGMDSSKDGSTIYYVVLDDWYEYNADSWYRSNEKGICYRNQWFKDKDGRWYYFNDSCKMVKSKLVDGYWIDADGVCE
jgi:hypothetical protein